MTWSERFAAYVNSRGVSQLDVVIELRQHGIGPGVSQVHYWMRGSLPRAKTRDAIERWSGGAVAARVDEAPANDGADATGEHPAVTPDRASSA